MIYGFEVSMDFHNNDLDQMFSRFIAEAIEANGLCFGGSAEEGFIVAVDGRTTENHRELVKNWLKKENVAKINVGDLVNANS